MFLPTAIVWIRVISPTISKGIGRHHRLAHGLRSEAPCLPDSDACQCAGSATVRSGASAPKTHIERVARAQQPDGEVGLGLQDAHELDDRP
jgi:hypothetical protein